MAVSRLRKRGHCDGGFTLIELMIVVAILGILASMALASYRDYVDRTLVAEGFTLASSVKNNVAEYYASTGNFPTSNAEAGAAAANEFKGQTVSKITVGGSGEISVAYSHPDINGNLVLVPIAVEGRILRWDCASKSTVRDNYLPSRCR